MLISQSNKNKGKYSTVWESTINFTTEKVIQKNVFLKKSQFFSTQPHSMHTMHTMTQCTQ